MITIDTEKPLDSKIAMAEFLSNVMPDKGIYYIATPQPGKRWFIHHPCQSIDEMVTKAAALDTVQQNVYFACASYQHESYIGTDGKMHYRTGTNASWCKTFWCEIDCGTEKAANGKGYETPQLATDALTAFCKATGLPIPLIVRSGGGLHCYWVFTETITKEQWLAVAFKFKELTKSGPVALLADPARTADIASVLRPVGTHNWKPERNGAVVSLTHAMTPIEFNEFESLIATAHTNMVAVRPHRPRAEIGRVNPGLTLDQLTELLHYIDPDIPRDDWWGVLAAIADQYGEAARDIARDWCAGRYHHRQADLYDEADFEYQYSDAVSRTAYGGTRKTLGTVVMMARNNGWNDPRMKPADALNWVDEINEKHAWIEQNASIYRIDYGDFIDPAKFCTQFNNQRVTIPNPKGSREVGKGTQWLKEPGRRQHRMLVVRPEEPLITHDNCLNEWRGHAIAPVAGNIKPFLRLLFRLIPNREARRFVLSWMAHLVQHPAVKMHVSLALWSHAQGVGKNLLAECLSSIIGSTHATVIGQAELARDFNGWANRKVLVIGDEVSSSDKRQQTDKLKGLITGTTIYLNEKHQPARAITNLMNFIFLSNHHDAIFVGDTDRRYFVWEIMAERLPTDMAQAFVDWREHGGLSSLLNFLLNHDISSFNPKAPAPMTEAKLQMVQDSRSDLENWIADLMASNVSQVLGREVVTASELGIRYSFETGHVAPSSKAIVGACKRQGAYARTNQVRLPNGKKVRVLALQRPDHWKQQLEIEWATELDKSFKHV